MLDTDFYYFFWIFLFWTRPSNAESENLKT